MRKETAILVIILFVTAGMGGCRPSGTHADIITVDITVSYPGKELILQDFMDVEYIALETNDEFVTQGDVMAIGNKYILVKNWTNDGDIFVFDRKTGKGLRNINRRGQGAEEYAFISGVVLDEDNNEIFVNCSPTKLAVQEGDGFSVTYVRPIIPYHNNWLLVEASFQNLAADRLVEAYENDELKGKLKEIAAELNDESNPVIMLMKCKK